MKFNHLNIVEGCGRPQSTVKVTKNEVPDNHPKRVWGIAQVLAIIYIYNHIYILYTYIYIRLYKHMLFCGPQRGARFRTQEWGRNLQVRSPASKFVGTIFGPMVWAPTFP